MPRRHDAVGDELPLARGPEMAIDANARAHHRILQSAQAGAQIGEMLLAHFAAGAGVVADPGIVARDPAPRRAVAGFAGDPVLDRRGTAARRRIAVAPEAHRRARRIADAEVAGNELAAAGVEHRPCAAMRAAGGRGFLPAHQLVLTDNDAVALHPAVAGRSRAGRNTQETPAAFALRARRRRRKRRGDRKHGKQQRQCRHRRPRPIAAPDASVRRHSHESPFALRAFYPKRPRTPASRRRLS